LYNYLLTLFIQEIYYGTYKEITLGKRYGMKCGVIGNTLGT
jgi:hypothetical protein